MEANFGNLRALGRQLKFHSGTIGKRPFWGQILAGSLLEAIFGILRAFGPAIKISFWGHWETAVLGQILAGSPLEANFGNLRAFGQQLKSPSGTIGKWPVWAKSWSGAFWKQLSAICGVPRRVSELQTLTSSDCFCPLVVATTDGIVGALCNGRESCPGRGAATYPDVSPSFKRRRPGLYVALLLSSMATAKVSQKRL